MNHAKIIASVIGVEADFPTKCRTQQTRHFDESDHEEMIRSPEEDFRVNYFLVLLVMSFTSLQERFEQLTMFQSIFGFLCESNKWSH